MLRRFFLKLGVGHLLSLAPFLKATDHKPLRALAFGCCNRTHLPQPMWPHIQAHSPDAFLWLGDVVYANTTDPIELRRKLMLQYAHPGYATLRSTVPVIGIWDDHDFGGNNQGRENPIRKQSQQLFLDFLDEPSDSARRRQQGIYTSYVYGQGRQQVKLILLDTRYHRDLPGTGRADTLGDAQWRWLERELATSTASVHLIASSYSVLSTQIPGAEEWTDFKWARKRLFHLLKKHRVGGVLFLTGDRHFAAFLQEQVGEHVFHEIMSSGLTHYLYRPRISSVLRAYYGKENSFFGLNFGMLNFNWSDDVSLTCRVYDKHNQQRLIKQLSLRDGYWVEKN
jgi:alkaline phosphatase D